jgi:hypothetical protein
MPRGDENDVRNSVDGCEMCAGSGSYDPLPKLLEMTDDKAAEAWIAEGLPRSSGPCDHWTGFPERPAERVVPTWESH